MNLCPLMTVVIRVDLDGGGYVVENIDPNVSARGKTASEALVNLAATLLQPPPAKTPEERFRQRLHWIAKWVAARTEAPYAEALRMVELTVAKRGIESLEAEQRAQEGDI